MFTISVYTSLNPSSKWKEGNIISYELPQTEKKTNTNIYIQTLIGNSYIEGTQKETLEGTWNSDRNLFVTSGGNEKTTYIKFNEDNNRNLLEKYNSNLDLEIPQNTRFNMLYIKNLF